MWYDCMLRRALVRYGVKEMCTYHKSLLDLLVCSTELVQHKVLDCFDLLRLRVVHDLSKGAQMCGVFLGIGILCARLAIGIAGLESLR